jgi:hypothetical protein
VISSKIGHGGGGVKLNADGPRPLGRWIERSEIWIRSGIALDVVDRSDRLEMRGDLRLIQVNSKSRVYLHRRAILGFAVYRNRARPLGAMGQVGREDASMGSNGCMMMVR